MAANLQRASVFGIIQETTAGTLKDLTAASDFIPLKTGFSQEAAVEELTSEEIINNLANTKSLVGKESPSGSHLAYLKNSEDNGFPEWSLLLASAMGTEVSKATTTTAVDASLTSVKVADGTLFEVGQAIILEGASGYIRNISSISGNILAFNFNITASAIGYTVGEVYMVKPLTTGLPTYSAWMYIANSAAIQAFAGCVTTSITMNMPAGQQAEIEFSYEGSSFAWNPVTIGATSTAIDFVDESGTLAATLTQQIYNSVEDLATEVATQLNAQSTATYTCTFSSTTGKYTITNTDGAVFSLLWSSGTHADDAGTKLGFADTDLTGALTYTSDAAETYAAAFTPSYDDSTNIVVKSAELLIGDTTNTVCRKASNVSVTIETPAEDVESICAASGVSQKLVLSRVATMTCSLLLEKHEVALYDKFKNNTSTKAMMNIGPKDGSGNWVPTKCVNINFENCSITGHTVTGDDIVRLDLTIKGFVTSSENDVYINFI